MCDRHLFFVDERPFKDSSDVGGDIIIDGDYYSRRLRGGGMVAWPGCGLT
jgi:hypothetical protein